MLWKPDFFFYKCNTVIISSTSYYNPSSSNNQGLLLLIMISLTRPVSVRLSLSSQDLDQWAAGAGDAGFIFFSLGSLVTTSSMPEKWVSHLLWRLWLMSVGICPHRYPCELTHYKNSLFCYFFRCTVGYQFCHSEITLFVWKVISHVNTVLVLWILAWNCELYVVCCMCDTVDTVSCNICS